MFFSRIGVRREFLNKNIFVDIRKELLNFGSIINV